MCGRYAHYAPILVTDVMREALASIDPGFDFERQLRAFESRYNIAPSQSASVLAQSEDGLALRELRWGLIPGRAKDKRIDMKAINARAETVHGKPMFRSAFKKRRALVPASGYFEWRTEGAGQKQPHFVHAPDRQLLLFAGLWEAWRPARMPNRSRRSRFSPGPPTRYPAKSMRASPPSCRLITGGPGLLAALSQPANYLIQCLTRS